MSIETTAPAPESGSEGRAPGGASRESNRIDRFAALAALTALGATWPVLDLLGRNAEFFIARRSPQLEILGLGLILALGIPILVALLGSLPGRAGAVIGIMLMALMATSLALLYVRRAPIPWWAATIAAVAIGVAATWMFCRFSAARLFARYLAPAPILLLLVFLFGTPAGAVLASDTVGIGSAVTPASPAPVVMIVLDEFPVASLMDADGNLRADRYPNFARLAADGIWFRNAVTVEEATEHSVPAMLTGTVPDQDKTPYAGQYPDNLFTALQDAYDLHVYEAITQLCPRSLCQGAGPATTPILRDVGVVAGHVLLPQGFTTSLPQIDRSWGEFGAATSDFDVVAAFRDALSADPRAPVDLFIDDITQPRDGEVPLYFLHALVPHHPWQFLPDGRRYPLVRERAPGSQSPGWGPDPFLSAQALQRHLLQVGYVDHALGRMFDALDNAGIYDDALVIVVADHGISVKPDVEHQRRVAEDTVGEIAAIPLFVKAPGGPTGLIDDRRALTIDILPTIAEVLGADLPWNVDGVSLLGPDPGRSETTTFGPKSQVTYGADGGEKLELAARLEDLFPGGDPWALRPAGSPNIAGDRVDVAELEPASFMTRLEQPRTLAAVNRAGDMIPSRITGSLIGDLDGTEILAVAVNGVIGSVTRSYVEDGDAAFQAMVPPELFVDGANELDLLLIRSDGPMLLVGRLP